MLKVAVKEYLKSFGDKVFVPNPDYPEFIDATCLSVVIKRKPKWFYQKPIYTYDNFGLNDLLDTPLSETDQNKYFTQPQPLTPSFIYNNKFQINEKIGQKIASIVSLDCEGDESISFAINFQDLMEQSVDYVAVQNMLKTKKVDLKGRYVTRLMQDKYNVVCLITKYIYINNTAEIKVGVNIDAELSDDVSNPKIAISNSQVFKKDKIRSITFRSGTKIAFDFAEVLIGSDGSIELLDRFSDLKHIKTSLSISPKASLPNYCAHITGENQNFDVPDTDDNDNIVGLFQSLSYLFNLPNVSEIKKHLLRLTLENKNILTKLEVLLVHCQQENSDRELDILTLLIFDEEMIKNAHLIAFFKSIGLRTTKSTVYVRASDLHPELLNGILCLIQSIYHLEVAHLMCLGTIYSTCQRSKIDELIFFLQNIKFLDFYDKAAYSRLSSNYDIKCLLRTVGVHKAQYDLNENFEPVLILLYGQ